ncbi:TIGR02452 family protein [Paenibacillus nanensis]|uniref:TIGR02452 family protein n=1 Tax=Paenibacillus nanensis TaxID=393251 RepID=UPI0023E7927E|nr:TIGR02452 family protein [Paenibacillus nanensis]
MSILKLGSYYNGSRQTVDISRCLQDSISASALYRPGETDKLLASLRPASLHNTVIEVTPETTLAAAKRLTAGSTKICCLSFASAKQPGGGFLTGARAQEESLARSSGLYPAISQMTEMYEHNARLQTGFIRTT